MLNLIFFIRSNFLKGDELNPIDCACDIPTTRPDMSDRPFDEGWEIRNVRGDMSNAWIPLYHEFDPSDKKVWPLSHWKCFKTTCPIVPIDSPKLDDNTKFHKGSTSVGLNFKLFQEISNDDVI